MPSGDRGEQLWRELMAPLACQVEQRGPLEVDRQGMVPPRAQARRGVGDNGVADRLGASLCPRSRRRLTGRLQRAARPVQREARPGAARFGVDRVQQELGESQVVGQGRKVEDVGFERHAVTFGERQAELPGPQRVVVETGERRLGGGVETEAAEEVRPDAVNDTGWSRARRWKDLPLSYRPTGEMSANPIGQVAQTAHGKRSYEADLLPAGQTAAASFDPGERDEVPRSAS
jgi:hypothetical protein